MKRKAPYGLLYSHMCKHNHTPQHIGHDFNFNDDDEPTVVLNTNMPQARPNDDGQETTDYGKPPQVAPTTDGDDSEIDDSNYGDRGGCLGMSIALLLVPPTLIYGVSYALHSLLSL